MKVVIVTKYHFSLWNAPQSFMDSLRREFPDIEFVYRPNYDNIEEYMADADIMVALRFGLSSSAQRTNCVGFIRLLRLSINCSFPNSSTAT